MALQLLACSLFVLLATAQVFTIPIHPNINAVERRLARRDLGASRTYAQILDERAGRPTQFQLTSNDNIEPVSHRVEITDNFHLNPYIIPAAIGNPPQPFRLLLDLAWDALFVPSADCEYDCKDNGNLLFWSNRSSTYSPIASNSQLVYSTDRFTGDLASDTFRVAGLEIEHQDFLNVARANPMGFISFYFGYDGVFGLAPRFPNPDTNSSITSASPWSNLIAQSLLPHNLFTLSLPRGPMGVPISHRLGELTLGGLNPKYTHAPFTSLPLSTYSNQVWAVEAHSLTWHNTTHPLHFPFTNFTLAGLDTTAWYIGLPRPLVKALYASIPHTCGMLDCYVACELRSTLPDLTLTLAGRNLTITAWDYVSEYLVRSEEGSEPVSECIFDLYATDDGFPVDALVLGRGVLEAFYWVLDRDGMEVRFTPRID